MPCCQHIMEYFLKGALVLLLCISSISYVDNITHRMNDSDLILYGFVIAMPMSLHPKLLWIFLKGGELLKPQVWSFNFLFKTLHWLPFFLGESQCFIWAARAQPHIVRLPHTFQPHVVFPQFYEVSTLLPQDLITHSSLCPHSYRTLQAACVASSLFPRVCLPG